MAKDLLGSKASRIASPIKISRISIVASAVKAAMPIQGACRLLFALESSRPKDGASGGSPKPRLAANRETTARGTEDILIAFIIYPCVLIDDVVTKDDS